MAQDAPARKKRRAYRRGWLAEYRAAVFLLAKGYRILAMRYRCKAGEIDIIARKKDLVIFVEVKARRQEATAIDAVGADTQRRIHSASLIWLSKQAHAELLSLRYDIVAVLPWRLPRHFADAF